MFKYEYPMPAVTVDIVYMVKDEILLIRRNGQVENGKLALPGGYMEIHERLEDAAIRELWEETGIETNHDELEFKMIADTPDRDKRGRVISIVYFIYSTIKPEVKAGDDAEDFIWANWKDVLSNKYELAFDHQEILNEILGDGQYPPIYNDYPDLGQNYWE